MKVSLKRIVLSFPLLCLSLISHAETLPFAAIAIDNKDGKAEVRNPIIDIKGPHHYHWSDMSRKELYNDQDLYHSMGTRAFWKNGKSIKGEIKEQRRDLTSVNGRTHIIVSPEEMAQWFDKSCADRISTEITKLKNILQDKPSTTTAILTFRDKGPKETSYTTETFKNLNAERIQASMWLDCERAKDNVVTKANEKKNHVVDSGREIVKDEKVNSVSEKKNIGTNEH